MKPTFLNERGVPIVGKRILIPRSILPHYNAPQVGVITRSGATYAHRQPTYMFVRLERDGSPRIRLYESDWYKCRELPLE
jgi:hypothetical protein